MDFHRAWRPPDLLVHYAQPAWLTGRGAAAAAKMGLFQDAGVHVGGGCFWG